MIIIRKSRVNKGNYENTTDGNRKYVAELYKEYLANAAQENVWSYLVPGTPSQIDINDTMKELANLQARNVTLSRSEVSFLIGTVLGDSSLQYSSASNTNPRLSCAHSARQSEWLFWKAQILWQILTQQTEPRGRAATTSYQSPKNSHQEKAIPAYDGEVFCRIRLQTPVSPCLTTLHKLMYQGKDKVILRSYLNYTDSTFLMALWLDDGSLNSGYQGMFSLVMFSEKELDRFCKWMKVAWNLDMTRSALKQNEKKIDIYPRGVYFNNQDQLKNFLRIVAPLIPVKTMIYKVCWCAQNNTDATQRWKTELKGLIREEWHTTIESYYENLVGESNTLGRRTLIIESNYQS